MPKIDPVPGTSVVVCARCGTNHGVSSLKNGKEFAAFLGVTVPDQETFLEIRFDPCIECSKDGAAIMKNALVLGLTGPILA